MQHLTTDRRTFLRGLGVGLALPALESFAGKATPSPHRLLAIETNMGILPKFFFPEKTGRDYVPTPYLEILNRHREQLTVFSGVSHPEVDGGHQAEICFLTAAPHPGRGGFRTPPSSVPRPRSRSGRARRG